MVFYSKKLKIKIYRIVQVKKWHEGTQFDQDYENSVLQTPLLCYLDKNNLSDYLQIIS